MSGLLYKNFIKASIIFSVLLLRTLILWTNNGIECKFSPFIALLSENFILGKNNTVFAMHDTIVATESNSQFFARTVSQILK